MDILRTLRFLVSVILWLPFSAVTAFWFASAMRFAFDRVKNIDWDTNTQNVMLTTDSYTPNQDTHEDKADVTDEIAGGGYSAGGVSLASKTITTTQNVLNLDAGVDPSWTSATFTARRAVYYDDSGATDADKVILSWVDFGQDESVTNGTFTLQLDADGVVKITATNAAGFP